MVEDVDEVWEVFDREAEADDSDVKVCVGELDGGEMRADTMLCCISEMRTVARFWFFVNLCSQQSH